MVSSFDSKPTPNHFRCGIFIGIYQKVLCFWKWVEWVPLGRNPVASQYTISSGKCVNFLSDTQICLRYHAINLPVWMCKCVCVCVRRQCGTNLFVYLAIFCENGQIHVHQLLWSNFVVRKSRKPRRSITIQHTYSIHKLKVWAFVVFFCVNFLGNQQKKPLLFSISIHQTIQSKYAWRCYQHYILTFKLILKYAFIKLDHLAYLLASVYYFHWLDICNRLYMKL